MPAPTVFGSLSSVTGKGGSAFGFFAQASQWAVANGLESRASGVGSTALGFGTNASGDNSISIGGAGGNGTTALSVTDSTWATQQGAIAIGANDVRGAWALNANAVAIGGQATARGIDAIALGRGSAADQTGAVAVGASSLTATAVATASGTIAGTSYAYAGATPASTVSIGATSNERTLTNLAAGRVATTSTDAVNGSQLNATNLAVTAIDTAVDTLGSGVASSLGGGSAYDPATGTLAPPTYVVGGTTYNNVGSALGSINSALTQIGNGGGIKYFRSNSSSTDAAAIGVDSVSAGPLTRAEGNSSVALGHASNALSNDSVAIGRAATAGVPGGNSGETAVGTTASATADQAAAFGYGSQASAANATAAGASAAASAIGAVALGSGAVAGQPGAVALGAASATAAVVATASGSIAGTTYVYAGTTPSSTVSIGAASAERTLTNLAAGRVGPTSTDAINGSQLNATNLAVAAVDGAVDTLGTGVAGSLGGGSTYDPATGTVSRPTYSVNGVPVNSVGAAINNIDGRTTTNTTAINNLGSQINNGSIGLVRQDATTRNLAVGATTDGTLVDVTGTAGSRVLTGLGRGAVTATSVDAVNGSQLFSGNGSIATTLGGGAAVNPDGTVSAPTYTVNGTAYNNVGDAFAHLASGGTQSKYFHANSLLADSDAQGTDSIAIGPLAAAAAVDALAMGRNAVAGGAGAVALGAAAAATGDQGIALGTGAVAAQDGAVALGAGTQTEVAVGTASITLGGVLHSFAGAAPASTVSVGLPGGERTLTHLAAGRIDAGSTDAVNGSQLFASNQSIENLNTAFGSLAAGGGIKYFRANSSADDASASGTDSLAAGPLAAASGGRAMALGSGAQAGHDNSVALGAGSQTMTGAQVGYAAAYVGSRTSSGEVNIGNRTVSGLAAGRAVDDAVNVGQLDGGVRFAIGAANTYTDARLSQISVQPGSGMFRVNSTDSRNPATSGDESVAGGAGAQASGNGSVAIGNTASGRGMGSVALGNGASAEADNSVAIGAGSIAAQPNAVAVGAAGSERSIIHVAAGTADTDAVNVAQLRQAQSGAQHYDNGPGGVTDYTNMTLGGPEGATTTRVHNVAAGDAPSDAVNVQQLQAGLQDNLVQSRQYTDARLQEVEGDMGSLRKEMRGGAASAMAMAGMPQSSVPGGNMLAVGMGGFQGEVGMAVGVSTMAESGRYVLKANLSTNTSHDLGFAVGAGLQW